MAALSQKYTDLSKEREPFLSRAKDYSKATIPQLMERRVTGAESEQKTRAYTSLGSRLVNHLANKIVMTLFPLGHNFFVPRPNAKVREEMQKSGITEVDISAQLNHISSMGLRELSSVQDRQTMIEIAKHLIVSGNMGVFYPDTGRCIVIPLYDFVCERDAQGNLTSFVWRQTKPYGSLSQQAKAAYSKGATPKPKANEQVEIFTGVYLQEGGQFKYQQELNGVYLFSKVISREDIPFDALRWSKVTGEHYGHSYVEECYSDLFTYRFLTKCMSRGMALMCDVKFLVKNGITNIQTLNKAAMGEFVLGDLNDIGILQLGKYADYSQVQVVREEYRRELGQAFMLNSAVRRDAERVTTYELRLDAAELEAAMGGVYSLMAEEWQKPLARRIAIRLDSRFKSSMDYEIITGLETLGLAGELDKIAQFGQLMQVPASWASDVQRRIKWGDYIKTVTNAIALEVSWLMSDEEYAKVQQAQQEAQQQQTMQEGLAKAIPTAVQPIAQQAAKQ